MSEQKKHVVVIGNGMAGFRFCEKLLEYDAHKQYSMTAALNQLFSRLFTGFHRSMPVTGKSDPVAVRAFA